MTTESTPKWRRLEPDERRKQIFGCAAELFGERPYTDVSTSDIATRAGVARGLINHYFGTKRELYLAVVRRALDVPYGVLARLPPGPIEDRVTAAVDWFLDMISQQEKMWLAAIAPEGIGRDPEVERILYDADRNASDRVLEAMGFSPDDPRWEEWNAALRAFGGLAKATGREWLVRESLNREQVHGLLSHVLLSLTEFLPTLSAAPVGGQR
ncbi:TetR/AcrR family transcriptional regulator [Saccharomonospora piscinae]|uniref:TetR/AcrR family transcriptional regulator n=1 Tax=Saccharomonospora piscinae TaxID=687388 RepID=UPI0004656D49|nr:TetR/AcrR family transcriptional regulator [Saccharomonospora piscinae]TLW91286.1 TetR/AcrR family transcriptional regulator [Saccharomonospora piscinae]